ncbi:rubrerythrin family protein [Halobacteriales archaeon QS_5_70_15]|nr:MAG: rubrerythrin family protein [Halobacteriales archaeon QS_5_70_15]
MTPEEFTGTVREANRTALSRLGSSKSLYADTMGDMDADAVLRAAADAEHHAVETYTAWAESEADPEAAEAFEATAREERDHYETVAGKLDGHEPSEEVPAIHAYLRSLDGTVERLGGFVGRTLAAEKSKEQTTGFFVGQAHPGTAQVFRGMGEDLDAQLERALDLLAEHCSDDADWERAEDAASEAIQAAYDEYTERLEGMGVNPKPVC